MEAEMCFECLQRRIESDFSDRLVFSYGFSDSHSALPLGSSVVVQVPLYLFTCVCARVKWLSV